MSWVKDNSPDQKAEAEVRAPLCCPGSQVTTQVRGASLQLGEQHRTASPFSGSSRGPCSWDKVHSWPSREGGSHSDQTHHIHPNTQGCSGHGLPPPHHAVTGLPLDERAELVEMPCLVTNVETTSVLLVVTTERRETVSQSRPGPDTSLCLGAHTGSEPSQERGRQDLSHSEARLLSGATASPKLRARRACFSSRPGRRRAHGQCLPKNE